jgi:hypothetical protein
MADDNEERRIDPEATAAPNRDRHGEPLVIDGEVTARDDAPRAEAPESPKAEEPASSAAQSERSKAAEEPSPARPRPRMFVAAALGGLAGAIVAAAILWFAGANADAGLKDRLAAVEAPVAELTRRVSALEAAAPNAKATADALKAAQGDVQAARADAAKAAALATKVAASVEQNANGAAASPVDLAAIEERLKKLESAPTAQSGAGSDLSSIETRLAKIEGMLAAPKNESRVAPETTAMRRDWTGLAVAAEAIAARLGSGAPYPAEQGALERLGADPTKLGALKAFAEKGAPTAAALAASFAKVAPDALKAAEPKESGGVMDRLMSNISKVVQITPIGEQPGDDPVALASQIHGALDRGNIGGAMALWARWPEPAQHASQDWAAGAQARLAADAAAQDVLNDAMAKLAAGDKQ